MHSILHPLSTVHKKDYRLKEYFQIQVAHEVYQVRPNFLFYCLNNNDGTSNKESIKRGTHG
jgi:hypothetical protein